MSHQHQPTEPTNGTPGAPTILALLWALLLVQILVLTTTDALYAATVDVQISDLESNEGRLMVQVLDSEAALADKVPAIANLDLSPQIRSFSVNLPAGTYAIRLLHDLDGNGTLNTNLLGMPSEPWAFSNNATGNFGPPSWQDMTFTISEEGSVTQEIRLNH